MSSEGNLISSEWLSQIFRLIAPYFDFHSFIHGIWTACIEFTVVGNKFKSKFISDFGTLHKLYCHPEDSQKLAYSSWVPRGDPAQAGLMILIDHVTWGNARGVQGSDTPLANVSQDASAMGRWPVLTSIFKRVAEDVQPSFPALGHRWCLLLTAGPFVSCCAFWNPINTAMSCWTVLF